MNSVTVYFEITDEDAVKEAAAQHLSETNTYNTIEECRKAISSIEYACRLLIDPGDLPGLEIQDMA